MHRHMTLKKHLYIALIIGLLLRLTCSYFDYGPFALDDYLHGLIPAHLLVDNGVSELPNYRSWLIVWMLSGFLKVGEIFGATTALEKIRVMLYGLGVFSLVGIYGTYLYVRNFSNKVFQLLSIYLVACYPLAILVSTRAFGETVAMAIILFGIGLSEDSRLRSGSQLQMILGLAVLGIACLFRFHVMLIWLSYVGCILLTTRFRFLIALVISALLCLSLQVLIDVESGRQAFGTFINYLHVNEGGAAGYGVTPWYSTWILVLGFVLAPFSLPLFRNFKILLKDHWVIFIPFIIFVSAHSVVPHKEERFMFPIVGIELIFLASLWSVEIVNKTKVAKYFKWLFIILVIPSTFFVCLVNFQSAAVDPLLKSQADQKNTLVLYQDWNTWSDFYKITLNQNGEAREIDLQNINESSLTQYLVGNKFQQVIIISSNPDRLEQMQKLADKKSNNVSCGQLLYASSLIDSIAFKLNPKHNKRRAPAMYVVCRAT